MKWVNKFGHDGEPQQVVGKSIVSFRMREDRKDFEFIFDDGSELRIFGNEMHPSFFLSNVVGQTRRAEAENDQTASSASSGPTC